MANENYSKDNVIFESVRSVLIGDNSNTGKEVREIHYYVSDRIVIGNYTSGTDMPQITMEIENVGDSEKLPSSTYILIIKIFDEMNKNLVKTKLKNI